MSQPVDLSPLQRELDNLRLQLCHCDNAGTCLGCQGVEMLRQQASMVVSAATQPVLLQVAQESQAALGVARQGTQAVEETVSGMAQIRTRVESIAQTILALADELASAAEPIMGKLDRIPVVIIRGLNWPRGESGSRPLLRDPARDLFR